VYRKGRVLPGLYLANRHLDKPLYIFEGFGSWVKLVEFGPRNCCCVGGTSFTTEQIKLIKSRGFRKIIICFDADQAGEAATKRFLDENTAVLTDMEVYITTVIPGEGKGENDAEWFIARHGLEAFLALPQEDMFEWRMQRTESDDGEKVAEEMVPFIACDPRRVRWARKIRTLSEATNISPELILADVEAIADGERQRKADQKRQLISDAYRDMLQSDEPQIEAQQLISNLDRVADQSTHNPVSISYMRDRVAEVIANNERTERQHQVWVT
jgi:DNA primase